jgi:uncharacterized protein YuzE
LRFFIEGKEALSIRKVETLLDIDVRKVLEIVMEKYGLKLPRKVITVDYGDDVGDLFIRFKHVEYTEGEPTEDGRVIVHYDKKGKVAAIEITKITTL